MRERGFAATSILEVTIDETPILVERTPSEDQLPLSESDGDLDALTRQHVAQREQAQADTD